MGTIGDISTTMGLDDSKWIAGAMRVQNQSKQLAQSLGSSSGGLGRGIGQAAFAVQDFTSVLALGGANSFSRALMSTMNNVQMLGMAFGPWGMALTAAAGALGSILIPKLFEGGEAMKSLADQTKDAIKELGNLERTENALKGDIRSVTGLDSSKAVKGRIGDIDGDAKLLGRQRDRLADELRARFSDAIVAGHLMPNKDLMANPEKMALWHPQIAKNMWGGEVAGGADTKTALMDGAKALAKMIEEEKNLGFVRGVAKDRLKDVIKAESDEAYEKRILAEAEKKDKDQERQDALYEQHLMHDLDLGESVRKGARKPMQVALDEIEENKRLLRRGAIDEATFDKAGKKIQEDYIKSVSKPHGPIESAAAGTKEAYSSFLASVRQADKDSPQVKLLQDAVANGKAQIAELKRIARYAPAPEDI